MRDPVYKKLLSTASTDSAKNSTIDFLTQNLKKIIRKNETVVICFPAKDPNSIGFLLKNATENCGARVLLWENDLRWLELLRLTFVSRATTIIGPPLVVLGLSKIAAERGVPLNIFNCIMADYPCLSWVMDAIENNLDCKVWGILGPGSGSLVSGFSCSCGRGVHIRKEYYGIRIVDSCGTPLPDGQEGKVVLYSKEDSNTAILFKTVGKLLPTKCACGNSAPKLVDISIDDPDNLPQFRLAEELLYWGSILECRVEKTEYGLELEVVVFQGKKLPKLPSCARLVVRPWNPETDIPLIIAQELEASDFYQE